MILYDRGFHSRNQDSALPGKGRRNRAAREREEAEEFAETAAGVGDNSLETTGSAPTCTEGFARMVALSVLAGNLTAWGGSCDSRSRTPKRRRHGSPADTSVPLSGEGRVRPIRRQIRPVHWN